MNSARDSLEKPPATETRFKKKKKQNADIDIDADKLNPKFRPKNRYVKFYIWTFNSTSKWVDTKIIL